MAALPVTGCTLCDADDATPRLVHSKALQSSTSWILFMFLSRAHQKTVKQECLPPAFQSLHPSFSSPPTRTSDLLYFNVFEMYYEIITVDDVERLCDCRVVEAMIVVRALYSSALLNIL